MAKLPVVDASAEVEVGINLRVDGVGDVEVPFVDAVALPAVPSAPTVQLTSGVVGVEQQQNSGTERDLIASEVEVKAAKTSKRVKSRVTFDFPPTLAKLRPELTAEPGAAPAECAPEECVHLAAALLRLSKELLFADIPPPRPRVSSSCLSILQRHPLTMATLHLILFWVELPRHRASGARSSSTLQPRHRASSAPCSRQRPA